MDMQYSMLTWLILFSYLFLLALPLGLECNCNTGNQWCDFFLKHAKLYCSKQNLSLSIILNIFLKSDQFQPQCSYKVYSYKKVCNLSI